jgi:ribonucleoside-diphosphate reductase alpha chain
VQQYGMRNSLLNAVMPTASSAHIIGSNECIEPRTYNVYVRSVLDGEYFVINEEMLADLEARGLWSRAMLERILTANGSVAGIHELPADVRALYKTSWEMSQSRLLELYAARAPFVDQGESHNVWVAAPTGAQLATYHTRAWKAGVKTGMYYLHTKPAAAPVKFTLANMGKRKARDAEGGGGGGGGGEGGDGGEGGAGKRARTEEALVCTREMREAGCVSCSG